MDLPEDLQMVSETFEDMDESANSLEFVEMI
jgi:hypothetical protein